MPKAGGNASTTPACVGIPWSRGREMPEIAGKCATTPACVGIPWSRGWAVVDSRARAGIGNLPNKATLSGVLRFLKAFAVPLWLISGGKETLVASTHLLGRVCVSLFGENRKYISTRIGSFAKTGPVPRQATTCPHSGVRTTWDLSLKRSRTCPHFCSICTILPLLGQK